MADHHDALTYGQLNQAANRLARLILAHENEPEQPIALLLDSDNQAVAAILAVLKARGIYVPLDPRIPRARISYILGDSRATLLLTNSRRLPLAREFPLVNNSRERNTRNTHYQLDHADKVSQRFRLALRIAARVPAKVHREALWAPLTHNSQRVFQTGAGVAPSG